MHQAERTSRFRLSSEAADTMIGTRLNVNTRIYVRNGRRLGRSAAFKFLEPDHAECHAQSRSSLELTLGIIRAFPMYLNRTAIRFAAQVTTGISALNRDRAEDVR